MNLSRRRLIVGSVGLAAMQRAATAATKSDANTKYPYASHQTACLTDLKQSWPLNRVGQPPSKAELIEAEKLLKDVPRGKLPYEVARWMADHKRKSSTGKLFSVQWSERTNPIIPWLFRFTDEAPCNDAQLDWCAAFVSWALAQGGRAGLPYADVLGDISALKCLAHPSIDTLAEGDVVLLRRPGGGHTAFFAGWGEKGKSIKLLGGNQSGGQIVEATYTLAQDQLTKGKLQLACGIPVTAFKTTAQEICLPSVIDGCDHLVAVGCDPGTWPKCQ